MGEVFAGFLCGYMLALAGAPALAFALARLRTSSALAARMYPPEAPVAAVVFVLHGALILACTGIGLILGLLLYAMRDAGEALGSPNIAFSLFVAGLALAALAPVAIIFARFRMQTLAVGLALTLMFGWLMPYMAQWSKFGSS